MHTNPDVKIIPLRCGGGLFAGKSHDACEVNAHGPIRLEYIQLKPGLFLSQGSLIVLPNVMIGTGSCSVAHSCHGMVLPDCLCFYGVISCSTQCNLGRVQLAPSSLVVTEPNSMLDVHTAGPTASFGIAIRPELWLETASYLGEDGTLAAAMRSRVAQLTEMELRQVLANIDWLVGALENYPEAIETNAIRHYVEVGLITGLVLAMARIGKGAAKSLPPFKQSLVVRQVREYAWEMLAQPITLADLCRVTGLKARQLQTVFQMQTGLSPLHYIKAQRLREARRLLRQTHCHSVTEAAMQFGFWHMAQFAVDYRRMFSECPSQTLRKRSLSRAH